ncbi:MAG: DUF5996 family protein [Acidobacteriota bacterium]|nr:DUF5996 family protein [Acidobacteriota bacterium]MDQ2972434.1 DUF5996 family protein [Pseudomonadota bacterium]
MGSDSHQETTTIINGTIWPTLPFDAWKDTYTTLHLWMQVVGKIALALAPPLNHCWAVALRVTPRGLTTQPLPYGSRSFSIQFDFIEHRLVIHASNDMTRTLALEPRTVSDFYHELMKMLAEMGLPVEIWPVAVEIPAPIRLDEDTQDHIYDPEYANRFWRILVQLERIFTASRCAFVGKSSPVNFFWGSFDLAVTRFSGRCAPLREGPAFARDAYSHEVISHGFWPGSGPLLEPAFYAYAAPEPAGLKESRVQPEAAYYYGELGEFILPYDAVRGADSPDEMIHAFIDSSYDRAADLAGWDRAALDREWVK